MNYTFSVKCQLVVNGEFQASVTIYEKTTNMLEDLHELYLQFIDSYSDMKVLNRYECGPISQTTLTDSGKNANITKFIGLTIK